MDKATFEALQKQITELNARLDEKGKTSDLETIANILKGNAPSQGGSFNSDEARAMRMFGAKNVQELISINTCDPKFKSVPMELKAVVLNLKMAVNSSRFIQQVFNGEAQDKIGNANPEMDRVASVKGMLDGNYFAKNVLAPRLKAFNSTTPGSGDEYVPTLLASFFIEELELARGVAGIFTDVTMPSQPYEIPVAKGFTEARAIGENTAMTDNQFTTAKLTFTATKFGEYYILPEEFTEDSAPDVFAMGTRQVVEAQKRAQEQAIVNGDKTATHMDADTAAGAANLAAKQFIGLRKRALANSANGVVIDAGNTKLSETHITSVISALGRHGVDPSQLVFIPGPAVYQQMIAFPSVTTIDKYGDRATVISGELAKYAGKSIVPSQYAREDLSAAGVYDNTGSPAVTNRAALIVCRKDRFWNGIRRPITVRVQQDSPNQDRWLMASYQRIDFQGLPQDAVEKAVGIVINIAK